MAGRIGVQKVPKISVPITLEEAEHLTWKRTAWEAELPLSEWIRRTCREKHEMKP